MLFFLRWRLRLIVINYGITNGFFLWMQELGTPNEKIWPGVNELPAMKKCTFTEYPYNQLQAKFKNLLTAKGLDLLNRSEPTLIDYNQYIAELIDWLSWLIIDWFCFFAESIYFMILSVVFNFIYDVNLIRMATGVRVKWIKSKRSGGLGWQESWNRKSGVEISVKA